MTAATNHYICRVFFNYNRRGEKAKAESAREESLTYLTRLFERVAQFACIAKDENKDKPCLMLKGYASLNSPCTQPDSRRWLGKCSICYPSNFWDTMNLCRLVCVDKRLVTVGRLSKAGNSNAKTFTEDPTFVVKLLVDSIEGRDFEYHQKDTV
jgi:hypothetical protein